MIKFRFKTWDELSNEYGEDWYEDINDYDSEMDEYLGHEISINKVFAPHREKMLAGQLQLLSRVSYDGWSFTPSMIIQWEEPDKPEIPLVLHDGNLKIRREVMNILTGMSDYHTEEDYIESLPLNVVSDVKVAEGKYKILLEVNKQQFDGEYYINESGNIVFDNEEADLIILKDNASQIKISI